MAGPGYKGKEEVSTTQADKQKIVSDVVQDDQSYQQLKDLNIKQLTQQYKTQGMVDFEAKKKAETVVATMEATVTKGVNSGQPLTAEQLKPIIPASITDETIRNTVLKGMLDMQYTRVLYTAEIAITAGDKLLFNKLVQHIRPEDMNKIIENGPKLKAVADEYAENKGITTEKAVEELLKDKRGTELLTSAIDGKYNEDLELKLREAKGLTTDKGEIEKRRADAVKWVSDAIKDLLGGAVKDAAEFLGTKGRQMAEKAAAEELERLKALLETFLDKKIADGILATLTDKKFKIEEINPKTKKKEASGEMKEIDLRIAEGMKEMSEVQTREQKMAALKNKLAAVPKLVHA